MAMARPKQRIFVWRNTTCLDLANRSVLLSAPAAAALERLEVARRTDDDPNAGPHPAEHRLEIALPQRHAARGRAVLHHMEEDPRAAPIDRPPVVEVDHRGVAVGQAGVRPQRLVPTRTR